MQWNQTEIQQNQINHSFDHTSSTVQVNSHHEEMIVLLSGLPQCNVKISCQPHGVTSWQSNVFMTLVLDSGMTTFLLPAVAVYAHTFNSQTWMPFSCLLFTHVAAVLLQSNASVDFLNPKVGVILCGLKREK